MSLIALYPGSFDPITNGHVNIVERSLRMFDEVVVAVATNMSKSALFSTEERIEMVRETFADEKKLRVTGFEGLLVHFARDIGARVIVRGLRGVADFEYEYQMANMNRKLEADVDTVFLMASPSTFYVSSRLVREVAFLGGDLTGAVPESVRRLLTARVAERRAGHPT